VGTTGTRGFNNGTFFNDTKTDVNYQLEFRVKNKVDFFEKCEYRKALLGWQIDLERLQKQLLENNFTANAYLGKEFIFTRRLGWRLRRYGNVKVLKRMWTLVESGVHNKLLNISYKPPRGTVFQPRPVNIMGNISVRFVVHSFGLLLSILLFIFESRKKIIHSLNYVFVLCKLLTKTIWYYIRICSSV